MWLYFHTTLHIFFCVCITFSFLRFSLFFTYYIRQKCRVYYMGAPYLRERECPYRLQRIPRTPTIRIYRVALCAFSITTTTRM